MSENNEKKDFAKNDDEHFSPDIIIRKRGAASTNVGETEVKEKSAFRLWLENFLYHYKWHSIAALFWFSFLFSARFKPAKKQPMTRTYSTPEAKH